MTPLFKLVDTKLLSSDARLGQERNRICIPTQIDALRKGRMSTRTVAPDPSIPTFRGCVVFPMYFTSPSVTNAYRMFLLSASARRCSVGPRSSSSQCPTGWDPISRRRFIRMPVLRIFRQTLADDLNIVVQVFFRNPSDTRVGHMDWKHELANWDFHLNFFQRRPPFAR